MDISELKAEPERLHGASFGWALSCCRRDHAQAKDVLQTVYLKILEGNARYRSEANFKTWLFAVIRKTALTEDAMEALTEAMKPNSVNEQQALSLFERVLDTEREIKRLHIGMGIRIKNQLTPPQQEKLHGMRMTMRPAG